MKLLDLDNSYVYFNCNKNNSWRTSIKSTLYDLTNNKKLYLTKECRAEKMDASPFLHPAKSELCTVVEDNNYKYLIRNNPVIKKNDFNDHYYGIRSLKEDNDEIFLKEADYKIIDFESALNHLNNRDLKNIFCKLDYDFQNISYSIFSKVEYINFSSFYNHLQPIMGYVPFKYNEKIYISYVARNINPKLDGNLEFRIRSNTNFSNFYYYNNYNFKQKIKKSILKLFNFIKVSDFYERISINKSTCSLYMKNL